MSKLVQKKKKDNYHNDNRTWNLLANQSGYLQKTVLVFLKIIQNS